MGCRGFNTLNKTLYATRLTQRADYKDQTNRIRSLIFL